MPASVWNTALSWTFEWRPMTIGSLSPRNTAPYQTLAPAATSTAPTRTAVGAIQAESATRGESSPSAISVGPCSVAIGGFLSAPADPPPCDDRRDETDEAENAAPDPRP